MTRHAAGQASPFSDAENGVYAGLAGGSLGPETREAALRRMSQVQLDVLVVGGGVVGAGCALDAATRGLRVGLVEARDYAAGTSSRSSKLIHGGLRYLEQLNFRLVREALKERSLILTQLAPHLARPLPFMYPLRHRLWERLYVGAGVLLYDTMGGRRGLPGHRHLTRRQALRAFPSLRPRSLVGAVQYYDGQVDDARHTMMLVRTAARYGASCASGVRVIGFLREGDQVRGARIRDLESGVEHQIRATRIINAAGVWTDEIQRMLGGRPQVSIRASKGVHLVVPGDRIRAEAGIISRTEKSVLLIIPWNGAWIIGTTDTDWHLDHAHPMASRSDVEYLLEQANRLLDVPLTREDVVGVYAGLRPLLAGESEETSRLSREHAVVVPVPGMVLVAGGKYTTYRVMAKDAVDAAVRDMPGRVADSCTDRIPLLGADGYVALWNSRHELARESGLRVARIEHLLHRYGSLTLDLLDLIAQRPALAEPIPGAATYLMVEACYAVLAEGALHLEDVLARRTRIAIETDDRGLAASEPVAALMASLLGWDDARTRRERDLYRAHVDAERDAHDQGDEQTVSVAPRRLVAPGSGPLR